MRVMNPTFKEALAAIALRGDAWAQCYLGFMYSTGKGVPQDYPETVKWYRKAADQGNAHAQCNLGLMYKLGQGVSQDDVQAHMWLNLAASRAGQDNEVREKALAERELAASNMTPDQIAEAQRLAREWKPK